jgi:hypothetical protein
MGWLVRDKLSDRKRRQLIEDAHPYIQPGETILDVTGGMVDVPSGGARRGMLVVTDQRVFVQTKHSGHSEVQNFALNKLTCEYSAKSNFGTIELVAGGDRTKISQILKGEGERIVPFIQTHSAGGTQPELRTAINNMIALAQGQDSTDPDWPLILKPSERLVATVQGAGLFEPRRGPGHYEGRSAGVSVPVLDTRMRVRVGKSAGTFIQGAESPTVIDTGNATVTTQRIVFQGEKYTREWDYSKLIGVVHYTDRPATAIQVSNREKTSGIVYPGPSPESLRLAMTVAIAIFNGETDDTIKELQEELAHLDPPATQTGPTPAQPEASQQAPEPAAPPAATTPPDKPPASPKAMWAEDPSGGHQYRWWNGTAWTDYVADNGQQTQDPLPSPH